MAGFQRMSAQHLRGQRNQVYLDVAARNIFDELRQREVRMKEELINETSRWKLEMERMTQKLETTQSEVAAAGAIEEAKEEVRVIELGSGTLTDVDPDNAVWQDVEAMLREQGMPNVEIRSVQKVSVIDEYLNAYETQVNGREERLLWYCSSVIDPRKVVRSKNGIDYRPFAGKLGRGLYGAEYAVYADSCFAYETQERTRVLMLFRAVTGKPFDYRNAPQKPSRDDNNEEPWPFNKSTTYCAAPNGHDCVWAPPDDLCKPCRDTPLGSPMKPLVPCRCFWTPPEYRPEAYNKINGSRSLPIRRVSSPIFCIYPPRMRGRTAGGDGQAQAKVYPEDLEPCILALPLAIVEYTNPDSAREPRWRRWVLANIDCNKVSHDIVQSAEEKLDNHGGGLSHERGQMKSEEEYMASLDAEFAEKVKEHKNAAKKLKQWEHFSEKVRQDEGSLTMELRAAKDVADEVINLRHDLKASDKQVKRLERTKKDLEREGEETRAELEETQEEVEERNARNSACCEEIDALRMDLENTQETMINESEEAASQFSEEQSIMDAVRNKLQRFEKDNADLRNKCLVANKSFFKKEQKDKVTLLDTIKEMEEVKAELEVERETTSEMSNLTRKLGKVQEEATEAHKLRTALKKAQKEADKLHGMRRASGAPTDVKSEYEHAELEVERLKKANCEIDKVEEDDPLYNEVVTMLRSQGLPNVQVETVYKTVMEDEYLEKYDPTAEGKKVVNLWLGSGMVPPSEILNSEHTLDYRQYLTFGRLGKGLYGYEYACYPDACISYETGDNLRSLLLFKAVVGKAFDFRDAVQDEGHTDDKEGLFHPLNKTATYWAPPYGYDSVVMPESAICGVCSETELGGEIQGECTCPIMPTEFQPETFNSQQGWAKNKIPYRRRISSPIYCISRPAEDDTFQAENGQSQHWGSKEKSKTITDWEPYYCGCPIAIVEYRNPDAVKEPPWRNWALDKANEEGGIKSVELQMLQSELETERHYLDVIEEDRALNLRILRKAESSLKTWQELLSSHDTHQDAHREVTAQSESLRIELAQNAEAAEEAAEKMREDTANLEEQRQDLESQVAELTEALMQARADGEEKACSIFEMQEYEQRMQEELEKERAEKAEEMENVRQELEAETSAFSEFREEYEPFRTVAEDTDPEMKIPIKMFNELREAQVGKDTEALTEIVESTEKQLEILNERLDLASAIKALEHLELKGPAGPLLNSLIGKNEEKTLDLRKKGINDVAFGVFVKRLPQFKKLTKLLLNDNEITPDGFEKLLPILPQLQAHIVELNLTGNKVGEPNKEKLKSIWKKMGKDTGKLIVKD